MNTSFRTMKNRKGQVSQSPMDDKGSWWYWFEKLEGNLAKCKHCDWTKDRGRAKSTSILRCHLKSKHTELYNERLQALSIEWKALKPIVSPKRQSKRKLVKQEIPMVDSSDSSLDGDRINRELTMNGPGTSTRRYSPLQDSVSLPQQPFQAMPRTTMNEQLNTMMNDELSKSFLTISSVMAKAKHQPFVKMCRVENFSAAHRLHNNDLHVYQNREIFGKCNNGNGHGHNYTWKVVLEGPVDPITGMVYNLADLKREMGEVLELVDHKHLDLDVPYFRDNGIVSTTENLAVYLYNEIYSKMSSPDLLKKVVVGETDKNSFSFSGKLQ